MISSTKFTEDERVYLRGGDEAAARKWVLSFLEGVELVVPSNWKERVANGEVVAEAVREWQMRMHPGHTASVVAIFKDGGVLDNEEAFRDAVRTDIPSLAVLGELDPLCSAGQFEELGVRDTQVGPQVGHGVVRDRVLEVADHISEFWAKFDKDGGPSHWRATA
ncbi:hypothetical protein NX059_012481 [Plenodomus lindquistii]|nr:hypothetical protein NX059_012481 [Plenodomus lindquistii]